MVLEERIEAAADAIFETRYNDGPALDLARDAIRAAFPELFTDPPTAWIAPWEADGVMAIAGAHSTTVNDFEFDPYQAMEFAFDAMRDSHLSTLKGEKGE
jgi:hypothetical protein